MSKFDKKIQAFSLRRSGASIKDIANALNVSRSTASIWCREVQLTKAQKEALRRKMIASGHKGRLKGALVNRQKRINAMSEGRVFGSQQIHLMSPRDRMIAGVALYWAEGSKKDNKFAFSNSDPSMILFMCKWLLEVFMVKKEDLMPRIFINEGHNSRISHILTFWSSLLKLPSEQFGKPTLLKMSHKKVYENMDTYYGVLSLRVRKSSRLKYNVLGMLEKMK